ncbi:hypothetical protein ACFSTI_25175 [Rhizorhabdus histidinilytica]
MGSAAAKKAAKAQANAAEQAQASQERMFDKQVELQAPFREAGLTAQNRILTLLGLSPANDVEGYPSTPRTRHSVDMPAISPWRISRPIPATSSALRRG